jgi:hypothetical protein
MDGTSCGAYCIAFLECKLAKVHDDYQNINALRARIFRQLNEHKSFGNFQEKRPIHVQQNDDVEDALELEGTTDFEDSMISVDAQDNDVKLKTANRESKSDEIPKASETADAGQRSQSSLPQPVSS